MPLLVAPSILSADFGRLADEIGAVAAAGADVIHIDVMDGRFVPNLTVGPLVVAAARRATTLPLDVHLMVVEPERLVPAFVTAGADFVTVHLEACVHLQRTLTEIRKLGAKAGVALNPATPIDALQWVAGDLDLVLVMAVNPGFGGQAFLPAAVAKVRAIRALLDEHGAAQALVSVDGGVCAQNAGELAAAGARLLVAGNAVFKAPLYQGAIAAIRAAAQAGLDGSREPAGV